MGQQLGRVTMQDYTALRYYICLYILNSIEDFVQNCQELSTKIVHRWNTDYIHITANTYFMVLLQKQYFFSVKVAKLTLVAEISSADLNLSDSKGKTNKPAFIFFSPCTGNWIIIAANWYIMQLNF